MMGKREFGPPMVGHFLYLRPCSNAFWELYMIKMKRAQRCYDPGGRLCICGEWGEGDSDGELIL